MKRIWIFTALCLCFGEMSGFTFSPKEVNTFYMRSNLQADDLDTFELAEDEADQFNIYLCTWYLLVNPGDRLAVKFTPPNYPFRILEASYVPVGSLEDSTYTESCKLIFYEEGAQGPGDQIGQRTASAELPLWFNWFDVSDLDMVVQSGSFYFAVEFQKANKPVFQYDLVKPLHHVSWLYTQDQGWRSWDNVTVQDHPKPMGDTADLILRIKGSFPSGDIVELKPCDCDIVQTSIQVYEDEIRYTLAQPGWVEVTLWDCVGRKLEILHSSFREAGNHFLSWDGSRLPSGTYFVCLNTPEVRETAKAVIAY
ncbi:hypothetical protein JXM67_07810 [candidate division WOR-3 bacterium]|nr:hypothetical protein [candidate division WOR-3 bacterium]